MMVNLISTPYNADIIAHEHMQAFAYVSIVEAVLKLGVALLLAFSPADKLITYSVLMVAVAVCVEQAPVVAGTSLAASGWIVYRLNQEEEGGKDE